MNLINVILLIYLNTITVFNKITCIELKYNDEDDDIDNNVNGVIIILNCSTLQFDVKQQEQKQWQQNNENISNKIFNYKFRECLKEKLVDSLSEIVNRDLINVYDGINLLKLNETNDKIISDDERKFIYNLVDNGKKSAWLSRVLEKIERLFKSHVLWIDLKNVLPYEGRGKHGHKMSSLIVFALVATGMILAPMGFKFLVVLGTKALLLAMLAMILTSIQGLKKIATSKINYGLYETHPNNNNNNYNNFHEPCTYDRRWYYKYGGGNGLKLDDIQTESYNYLNPRDSIDIKRIENSYR